MKKLSLLIAGVLIPVFNFAQDRLEPVNLLVEGLTESPCIDLVTPRFSWQTKSQVNGQEQTAYRVIVASSEDKIRNNIGDMYDSGKIMSPENAFVPYKGKSIISARTYWWKVKIWDKENKEGDWSEGASWISGLILPKDKKAGWIINNNQKIRAPLFRKEFEVNKPIKNAIAYATGMGIYYLYVNGEKVGDTFMDPGMTNYKSRILYEGYNLKPYLNEGRNAVGLLLGEGFGAFSISMEERFRNRNKELGPYAQPMGWFQLEIEYEDGSKETIISDTSWKTSASPFSYNNFYGGEDYDATLGK